jgi:hypothetical protein
MEFTTHLGAALSSNPTLRRDPPATGDGRYGPGTLYGLWPRSRWTWTRRTVSDDGPSLTPHFPASGFGRGIQCWALPCSLAATEGILVSFFSSA